MSYVHGHCGESEQCEPGIGGQRPTRGAPYRDGHRAKRLSGNPTRRALVACFLASVNGRPDHPRTTSKSCAEGIAVGSTSVRGRQSGENRNCSWSPEVGAIAEFGTEELAAARAASAQMAPGCSLTRFWRRPAPSVLMSATGQAAFVSQSAHARSRIAGTHGASNAGRTLAVNWGGRVLACRRDA
jgi:hypothetical protein